jgi:hypothetical protein
MQDFEFQRIGDDENTDLIVIFLKEEIKRAI